MVQYLTNKRLVSDGESRLMQIVRKPILLNNVYGARTFLLCSKKIMFNKISFKTTYKKSENHEPICPTKTYRANFFHSSCRTWFVIILGGVESNLLDRQNALLLQKVYNAL